MHTHTHIPFRILKDGARPRPNVNKDHACGSCIFHSNTCGASGPIDSPFVIVGESPGKQEMLFQQPFIGESGELLRSALMGVGFDDSCPLPYITNAVKCIPDKTKNQSAMANACKSCRAKLFEEITAYPREIILALGASAAWTLTGDFGIKITQTRGTLYPSPLAKQGVLVTIHPAFLLRGGGSLSKFKADVGFAIEKLKGTTRPQYKLSHNIILETLDDFYQVARRLDYTIWWYEALGIGPVEIGTDLETSGFSALENYILSAHFGWEDTVNYTVPDHVFEILDDGSFVNPAYVQALKLFYEYTSDKVRFVWHNGKFDIQFLWALGIEGRVNEDTMLLSYALDENPGLHDLEQVANDAIGAPNWKGMLEEHLPYKGCSYAAIPRPVLYKYGGLDIGATIQSYHVLKERVARDKHLVKAYNRVLVPASKLLARIEYHGVYVNLDQNRMNMVRLKEDLDRILEDLNQATMLLCGRVFNPASPIQMAELLYDVLKLTPLKGKGLGTGKDILTELKRSLLEFRDSDTISSAAYTILGLILEHRKAAKQFGTYVINLIPHYDKKKRKIVPGHMKKDGRVHATFLIHGTVTGRLASRKPNMQNPPRDGEIRGQFGAPPGYVVSEVDLNQAELRSLAELSGDEALINLYNDPEHPGLHHETSVAIFGQGYTKEDKMLAKAVNFGIVYGRTGASIALAHNMPINEGEEWINRWAARFSTAWQFIQDCRRAPLDRKALVTCFGRKRRFSVVSRKNLQSVQNEASNFPHQSTASDITLVSHINLIEDPRYTSNVVNLIHDAGLHEILDDSDVIDQQISLIIHYMETEALKWGLRKVPFKAEAKVGKQWGKLTDYKVKGNYRWDQ